MMNSLVAILLLGLAAFARAEVTCDECVDATSKKKGHTMKISIFMHLLHVSKSLKEPYLFFSLGFSHEIVASRWIILYKKEAFWIMLLNMVIMKSSAGLRCIRFKIYIKSSMVLLV
jgi:hypothetical protein